jgi:hypothetical protein
MKPKAEGRKAEGLTPRTPRPSGLFGFRRASESEPSQPSAASNGPLPGDIVLDCCHTPTESIHWFKGEFEFRRPDGSRASASWLIQCQSCFLRVRLLDQAPIEAFSINGDFVWEGGAPQFVEPS